MNNSLIADPFLIKLVKKIYPYKLKYYFQKYFPGYYKYIKFKPPRERFLTIFMDIQDTCNLHCKMCHFGFLGDHPKDPKQIKLDDFKKFGDNVLYKTEEIAFSPCTDPLVHSNYSGLLDILKNYNVPKMWMMTNLQLLTEEIAEKLVRMKFYRLLISMDSYKKNIYEDIKRGAKFEVLIKNIEMINNFKKKYNTEYPLINFNFVLMNTSVSNYDGYLKFVKEIGGTSVGFFHVVVYKDVKEMSSESMWHHKEKYNEFYDKVIIDSKKYGVSIERIPEKFNLKDESLNHIKPETNKFEPKCRYPWYILVVYPNGTFKPCEFWFNQKPWGNLINDKFEEIWESDQYKKLRWEIAFNKPSRTCCRKCVSMSDLKGNVNDPDSFREIVFE
ncbi:SPASM domain-containing protein [Candidatus Dependentiae bacterium]|nr:SPASM domain-containing protein [Candidatus Dependentiae bacterium]